MTGTSQFEMWLMILGHCRPDYLSRLSALPAVLPSPTANSPALSALQPAVVLVHQHQLSALELLTAAMLRAVALKAAMLQGLTCLLCQLWDLKTRAKHSRYSS